MIKLRRQPILSATELVNTQNNASRSWIWKRPSIEWGRLCGRSKETESEVLKEVQFGRERSMTGKEYVWGGKAHRPTYVLRDFACAVPSAWNASPSMCEWFIPYFFRSLLKTHPQWGLPWLPYIDFQPWLPTKVTYCLFPL